MTGRRRLIEWRRAMLGRHRLGFELSHRRVGISRRFVIEHGRAQCLGERLQHAGGIRREAQPHPCPALCVRLEARDLDLQQLVRPTDDQLEFGHGADVGALGGDEEETPRAQRLA